MGTDVAVIGRVDGDDGGAFSVGCGEGVAGPGAGERAISQPLRRTARGNRIGIATASNASAMQASTIERFAFRRGAVNSFCAATIGTPAAGTRSAMEAPPKAMGIAPGDTPWMDRATAATSGESMAVASVGDGDPG
jgi:hypothetical protein